MSERLVHVYVWGNTPRRSQLRGRMCIVIARGTMGSVLIELLDSHERIVTARRALRRATTAERGRRTGRDDA